MRKLLPQLLMAVAAVALPQMLLADDSPKPPQRPNPESMFQRLDANKDGVITADELPAGMPERLKQMLIKADKNGDKKLSLDELKEAFKARRPEGRPEKRPEGRPEKRPDGPNPEVMFKRLDANKDGVITADELPAGMPERLKQMLIKADKNGDKKLTPEELKEAFKARRQANRPEPRPEGRPGPRPEGQSRMGPPPRLEGRSGPEQFAGRPPMLPRGEGRPEMGLWEHSLQGIRANLPELPNLKVIFERLDADKDGKLSFDEFKVGMEKLHRFFTVRPDGNPAPATRLAAGPEDRQPRPWLAMRQTGWEPAGRPGPQFQGPGPQGRGPQFQGYARGWQPGRGPQFQGYAHGWQPGRGPQFQGYAHGWQPGRGPQFQGYAHGWQTGRGPQFQGPGPQGYGPQFHGYAMNQFSGRGPQHHGYGMGYGPRDEGPGPQGPRPPFQGHGGHGPHPQGPDQE